MKTKGWALLVVSATTAWAEEDGADLTKVRHDWISLYLPIPETDPGTCGSYSPRICDPDSIIAKAEIEGVAAAVDAFENSQLIECQVDSTTESSPQPDSTSLVPVQLAVAIVEGMPIFSFQSHSYRDEDITLGAENAAFKVHNSWGIGRVTPCGGTGILIFLSIRDRAIYISIGDALKNVLTDNRLDRVIIDMKPLLRQLKTATALRHAVDDIAAFIQLGEPSFKERMWDSLEDALALLVFMVVGIIFVFKLRQDQRRQREYAQVESQLSQIDRSRAEALQGRYQCTSCPICLESFVTDDSQILGQNQTINDQVDPSLSGSDGLPLKLLRCGHVFDETCWSEWVSSGSGDTRRCPICQQDVGSVVTAPPIRDDALRQRQGDGNNGDVVVQQFNRERNFRLMRLGARFPHYVGQREIQRWSQPNYEGSLARDPTFSRNNPSHPSRTRATGGGHSFGGGMSTRGRGSRW